MIKFKNILISGTSSGLGKALSIKLSKYNTVYSIGRTLVKKKNIKSVKCDFKNIKNLKRNLQKLIKVKRIDYVFLNAGMLGEIKNIYKIKYREIIEILNVNTLANKEILDFLIKKKIKTKLIVAISSGAALKPKIGWFLYCISKAALKFLIESYALEDLKHKYVNISPGLIKTKMQKKICKVNEKKIPSVKKFKILNKKNLVPSPEEVAQNLIKIVEEKKFLSGEYLDIR